MALETLRGVSRIGDANVVCMDDLRDKHPDKFTASGSMDYVWFEKDIRLFNYIYVRHDVGSIAFTIQNGPISENGVNGCQVDHMIIAARMILDGLNKNLPCRETALAVTKLDEAVHWLRARRDDRVARGVEGTNKP